MERLGEAARAIEAAPELALACHVGPDGDALGSMLGLALAAQEQGKKAVASFGSPFVVPGSLRFLPGLDLLVPPSKFPAEPVLMVVHDVGSADRLGELASSAGKAGTVVVLDHHVTNQGFGDITVIDGDVAATGEIVYRLLLALGWPISTDVAQCLLTAIITDTGRFQYSNTSPETMRVAAALVEAGGRPHVISRHVYEEVPFGYLVAAGNALARASLDADNSVVSTIITDQDLKSAGIDWDDTDNLIDSLRLAEEADVAVLVKAHDDGRVRISLRSRGATDVGSLAVGMGGGGHRLAAGFTTHGDPEEALAIVIAKLEENR
jgi:nanoRNase/pAp phosphatase (c-di-AMP/oligoRNAs hydrolase)